MANNYAIASGYSDSQDHAIAKAQSILANQGIDITAALPALSYFSDSAFGAGRRTAFDQVKSAGLLNGLSIWGNGTDGNIFNTVNDYATASSWGNLPTFLGKVVSIADKRSALSAAANNANISGTSTSLQAGFDSIMSDTTNNGSHLFDRLSTWSDMNSAITWWQTTGNPAIFNTVYTAGSLSSLTSWGNGYSDGKVLYALNLGIMAQAAGSFSIFNKAPTWNNINAAVAWWQTPGNPGVLTPIMSDTLNNGSHLFDRLSAWDDISSAITWWQTTGNRAKFNTVYTDTVHNVLGEAISSWGTIATIISGYIDINSKGLMDNILGTSESSLISGAPAHVVLNNYGIVLARSSSNLATILDGVSGLDARNALANYVVVLGLNGSITLSGATPSDIRANLVTQATGAISGNAGSNGLGTTTLVIDLDPKRPVQYELLAGTLLNFNNLISLTCTANDLSVTDILNTGNAIGALTTLTSLTLNLYSNTTENQEAVSFANSLATLTNLTSFNFILRGVWIDSDTESIIRGILSNIAHDNQYIQL
jgi:hypothetical protein